MLSSEDLRFFALLARQGNLAAAARALGVTPPAVTQRLQALEARVGLRLLDRSTRRAHRRGRAAARRGGRPAPAARRARRRPARARRPRRRRTEAGRPVRLRPAPRRAAAGRLPGAPSGPARLARALGAPGKRHAGGPRPRAAHRAAARFLADRLPPRRERAPAVRRARLPAPRRAAEAAGGPARARLPGDPRERRGRDGVAVPPRRPV
ncbi:MAG: LysR family transcriptional regulator, partial [Planctomycetes bacterium]|nr:LysR family transcriptional regulator [Planctomycetota bacterium]